MWAGMGEGRGMRGGTETEGKKESKRVLKHEYNYAENLRS